MFHRGSSFNVLRIRIPNLSYKIILCWVLVYKAEHWKIFFFFFSFELLLSYVFASISIKITHGGC